MDNTIDNSTRTPDFKEYLKNSDINGYLTELHRQADKGDRGSLHVLLYLAIMDSEVEDVMDYLDKLVDMDDDYAEALWPYFHEAIKQLNEELGKEDDDDKYKSALGDRFRLAYDKGDLQYEASHPEFKSPTRLFGDKIIIMQRAYLNHVGLQVRPKFEDAHIEKIEDCTSKELRDYWRSLYSRSDCSSNQESIYNDAIPFAKLGDPYAMFIVGYLLRHGIRTRYDFPRVTILEGNDEDAYPWLKAAADAGIKEACAETASILLDRKDKDPEAEALGLYYAAKGAEQNDKNSLEKLFYHFKDKDDEKAFEILERLAKVSNTYQYDLMMAQWYEEGRGTEKDEKKAFEIVEHVYNHSSCSPYSSSHEDACEKLQYYLRNGIGCEKDIDRAWKIASDLQNEEDDLYEILTK